MVPSAKTRCKILLPVAVVVMLAGSMAKADTVTDWNRKAGEILVDSGLGPLPVDRALAIVHASVYEAVNAITRRYPVGDIDLKVIQEASVDAAIASANRTALAELVPSRLAEIDVAYETALITIADDRAKTEGIAIGNAAAAAILAMRAGDGAMAGETYRPRTSPGVYVPTVIPEAPQWAKMRPWLMADPAQFRPGPPPRLDSALWARDYNEVKTLGGKHSHHRTAEQTNIALFWEEVMPPIYHGVVRSVAEVDGREITQNARLFAAVTQASHDALIAVFDAKYHYGFWRPVTAIRNGDIDGNEATERDPSWLPFIETPMHPEYPCAHCIVAGAVGAVLQAEIGTGPEPLLTTVSNAAGGVARSWTKIDDLMQEVNDARIYDGVHYRNSGEVGASMGRQIGELAVKKYLLLLK
jgi:hypothetical protein